MLLEDLMDLDGQQGILPKSYPFVDSVQIEYRNRKIAITILAREIAK